tara:strand:- start:944 stop:1213 length:270 start_codon:yes stop_codon:yes gene_type:complete
MFSFNSYSKVCEIKIVKTFRDLKEKIKICDKGDKLYINYDIKLIGEELIVNLCSLKDTVIFKEESKIIHKRKSGASIICTYDPSKELIN